ncbi:uncharacterized protein LOC115434910 [Sphaeramia orbicularis]|uniref:uncharacterized protein LOC115434910 n=1 Tax=Sphaeramia orbicularis TaxID=375764 RepID=UPI00117E7C50|nr:uncharacterized protein LOC115434910 [Sphaeramia orbicularis]
MDKSEYLTPNPLKHSSLTMVKETTTTTSNQMMSYKAFSMQRIIQMVHSMVERSCRRACQFLCCPLNNMLCDKFICCPDQDHHQPPGEKTAQETVPPWSPQSTILIVNISNSTLIDCVIGNDAFPSTVAESQPLMQRTEDDETRCSCSHRPQGAAQTNTPPPESFPLLPSEQANIQIHNSSLSCVIIGDNNYMQVEQSNLSDEEL